MFSSPTLDITSPGSGLWVEGPTSVTFPTSSFKLGTIPCRSLVLRPAEPLPGLPDSSVYICLHGILQLPDHVTKDPSHFYTYPIGSAP